jgi:hypothetical protein
LKVEVANEDVLRRKSQKVPVGKGAAGSRSHAWGGLRFASVIVGILCNGVFHSMNIMRM